LLHLVINCGLCEEAIGPCIESVRGQNFLSWKAWVTVDRAGDRTLDRAVEARGDDPRVDIVANRERLFPMANLLRAIDRSGAAAEDVIVILDGDDRLIRPDALSIIARTYEEEGAWVTYGSWISNRADRPGRWPAYPPGTSDFRNEPWLGTAVRTWKKWLFDRIDRDDFLDPEGRFFRVTEDLACMYPLLEMATTERAKHIAEPLMLYNLDSHHDPGRAMVEEGLRNAAWLRKKKRYEALVFHASLAPTV
jgi:glycosyltransferase involved in cell wall biosynthesis